MPIPVYSKCLYESRLAPVADTVVYSVPAGYRAVVRDIVCYPPYAAQYGQLGFQIRTVVNTVIIYAVSYPHVPGSVLYHWNGDQVVMEGDGIRMNFFQAQWNVRISGYELTLP